MHDAAMPVAADGSCGRSDARCVAGLDRDLRAQLTGSSIDVQSLDRDP
jgi:hypothetical protein